MKRRILGVVVFAAFLVSCGGDNNTAKTNNDEKISVEVGEAIRGDMTIYRDYTGTVEGVEQAVLIAKVGETVKDVRVRPGDRVKEGDFLISFDKTGPSSSFQQAQAYYQNAEKTIKKMKYLYEEGAISEQDYDNAQTAFEVAEANYQAARDIVEIRSPISGVVTDLPINSGDQTFVGQEVATVSRIDSLRLAIGMDADEVRSISSGTTARVYAVGNKENWIEGIVTRVASSADPKTRAFKVEISVPNQNGVLQPGSFAGCKIPLIELTDVTKVPDESILLREGLKKVFIVRGDTASAAEIVTGESSDGYTQVVSGVEPGDLLVTVGHAFLQEKSAVNVSGGEAGK